MERIYIDLVIDVRCLYSTALGNVKQDSGRRDESMNMPSQY